MSVSGKMYGHFPFQCMKKEHDIVNDALWVMLTTVGYVPDQANDAYKSDVTNEVPNGSGYVTGGQILTGKTLNYTAGTRVTMIDANDTVWAGSSITARCSEVYNKATGADATRGLVCYDLSTIDIVSNTGNFTIVWDAAGIARVTAA